MLINQAQFMMRGDRWRHLTQPEQRCRLSSDVWGKRHRVYKRLKRGKHNENFINTCRICWALER